ncbi:MAG: hypothetical protein Kow00124_03910 [Anaerolineae bacterium]
MSRDSSDLSFDQITDHLYVGGRLSGGDWHILAALGVTVNINLQLERQDHFSGSAPEVHLWVPTADWFGPGLDALRIVVPFIGAMIRQGRLVYVHCNAGMGRAPTAAAAYLVTTGMSVERALALLREKRPATYLNHIQLQQLEDFAASLNR